MLRIRPSYDYIIIIIIIIIIIALAFIVDWRWVAKEARFWKPRGLYLALVWSKPFHILNVM
jgi:hypothetical protein